MEVPEWVQLDDLEEVWREDYDANVAAVAALNKEQPPRQLDLLMLGDSLTAYHRRSPEAWEAAFGDVEGLPLGMRGSTVESLAWRVMKGGERLAVPPRVAVLLIG